MQSNIDEETQKKRRQDAMFSTFFTTAWLAVFAFLKIFLGIKYNVSAPLAVLLMCLALIELGMIILVWILLKRRLKEIEGGEEDAATQY